MSSSSECSANCSEHSVRSASALMFGNALTWKRNGDFEPLRARADSDRADGVGDDRTDGGWWPACELRL